MRANLLIKFESGLGDTYSTLASALEAFNFLESLGYDTTLVIETRRNVYFSHTHKLDVIFNMTPFKGKVVYNIELDGSGNPDISKIFGTQRIPQHQKSYWVYVDKVIDELNNYESIIYGHPEIKIYNQRPNCELQLLSDEVIKISNKMVKKRNNIIGIHFRPLDLRGNNPEELDKVKQSIHDFIEKNSNKNFLVSSNGTLIRDYLKDNYKNILTPKLTYENLIPFYPCYTRNPNLSENDYIRHAREIAAEMSLYRKCEKIISFAPFLSNFMTYGILNNIHTKDYNKLFNL